METYYYGVNMFYGDHTVQRTVPFLGVQIANLFNPQGPLRGLTDRFASGNEKSVKIGI